MSLAILMFCPQFRPIVGGAERQAEKLSIALAALGCRVKVLTPQYDPSSKRIEHIDGIEIERFPLFNLKKILPWARGIGFFNLLLIKAQIKKVVSANAVHFDIVHTHIASPLTAFAVEAAAQLRKPVLCKIAMAGEQNDLYRIRTMGIGGRGIARRLESNMSLWIATTRAVEDTLIKHGIDSSKIALIPNGVVLKPVQHRNTDAIRFLYLGRLSSDIQRDVPTLIAAFDRLAEEFVDIELAIVGGGDLFDATKSLALQAKHSSRIKLLGEQAPDKWLNWANCYVQPSLREGLSNALLEAMASGLACIANDIPPNREVLGGGQFGFLTPIGDCDSLYRSMRLLATDSRELLRWGALARERAATDYSIEAVSAQYIELYRGLLSLN